MANKSEQKSVPIRESVLAVLKAATGPLMTSQVSVRARYGLLVTRETLTKLRDEGIVQMDDDGIMTLWALNRSTKVAGR